jgi:hypothetical protein
MDSAEFHFLASVFGGQAALRNHTPVERIRQLRAEGLSLADVAQQAGTTVGVVRGVCGNLDPELSRRHRSRQEEIAGRIDAEASTWPEKVERWKEETGQSETTFWRVLQRSGNHKYTRG